MIPQDPDTDQSRFDAHCGQCGEWLHLPGDHTDAEVLREWDEAHDDHGHGCRFEWCKNDRGGHYGADLEHFSDPHQIPATAEITHAMVRDCNDIPTVDLSIWYQEDLEAGPDIHLSIGGQAADLKIEEACLLADSLRRLINLAVAGTKIDPAAIVKRRVDL